jgi:hypothetical protein
MRVYPQRPSPPVEPLWTVVVAPAAGLAVLLLVLTDSAAALSGLLSKGRLPALRGGWIEGAALLVGRGLNPAAAWSRPSAAPPRWLFISVFAVLLSWSLGVGLGLWLRWPRIRGFSAPSKWSKKEGFLSAGEAAAQFGERAARREAARLHPSLSRSELLRRPLEELAIPLGRCGRSRVFASHEHAVAVLAGMRQGKTAGILARVALAHRGPLVYTTSKPADLELFFQCPTGSRGRTILFNPDDLASLGTATFDPVAGCADPEVARLRAEAILARQRARLRDRGLDWALLAEKLLKYLMHASALEALAGRPGGMRRVVTWAATTDFEGSGLIRALKQSPTAPGWSELLEEMGRSAPETLYSIKINLHEALVCWEDPGLLERVTPSGGGEEIDPERVVEEGDRLLVLARPGGHAVLHRFAPDVPVRRYHGGGRHLIDLAPDEVVLTTYGMVLHDRAPLAEVAWDLAIADEAQAVKNPLARTARELRAIPAGVRVALTGTPVENRLSDLWSILDWTTPGLLERMDAFHERIAVPVERYGDIAVRDRLAALVRPFLLRPARPTPTSRPSCRARPRPTVSCPSPPSRRPCTRRWCGSPWRRSSGPRGWRGAA